MESTKRIIISLIFVIANCLTAVCNDSLFVASEVSATVTDSVHSRAVIAIDTIKAAAIAIDSLATDSAKAVAIATDSLKNVIATDSTGAIVAVNDTASGNSKSRKRPNEEYWMPNPSKAMWLSLLLPGAGQIYNRSYWKVPLIYGLGVGCFYVVSFQGRMYKEYSAAYYSMVDSDPLTNDYDPIFEGLGNVDNDWKKTVLERKMNSYRRYRDMCIFASVLLYLGNALDAFVDAHLYDFSITEDLSINIQPEIKYDEHFATVSGSNQSLGLKLTLNFGNRK